MLWLSESYNIIHDYFAPLIKMKKIIQRISVGQFVP